MILLQKFKTYISKENLFSPKDTLLLAVSGGVDSVVLCELCNQAGYDFVIAHCNFQLRGEESERDEQLVKNLGQKYGKEVLVKRFNTQDYATEKKVSIQVAARELRYAWFDEIVNRQSSDVNRSNAETKVASNGEDHSRLTLHDSRLPTHILTAHHLDDNIETVLMNFFKGTGIAGLRGILPKQGEIVRPLLFAKKEELKSVAEENKLEWVEDSSNQSDKYARNYFRNQIIPLVKKLYPEAESNLSDNLQRFKDIEILYHQSVEQHKKKLLEFRGNEIHIPVLKLQKTVPLVSIVYEIIKDYGFSPGQAEEVIELLNSETGRYVQSASHRIIKNRDWIIISSQQNMLAEHVLIESTGKVLSAIGNLNIVLQPNSPPNHRGPIPNSPNTASLDAICVHFPLLLRKWKTGDYFYPLGMQKKKKLARFFIDNKLSKTDKEKIWVLEANKKIVWVVGHRIDDRFKITPQTKEVLKVEWSALK